MMRCTRVVIPAIVAMVLLPVLAWAGDTYLGDATIYSAAEYVPPNVLFIIDNNSTMGTAANSAGYDQGTEYVGPYEPYSVYKLTGQGTYVRHIQNSTPYLENVSCPTASTSLQTYSSYTGGGPAALKADGTCGGGGAGTTYLGNLLNYNLSTSTGTGSTQIEIIRQAVANVVGAASATDYGVNFGLMVFNSNNKGGNLVMPVADLSHGALSTFDGKLPGTPSTGVPLLAGESRPMAEALRDAHFYFDQARSSSVLPISGDSAIYDGSAIPPSPIQYSCQKNFVILITNGATIGDSDNNLCKLLKPGNYIEGGSNNGGDYDSDGNVGDKCQAGAYGNGTHLLDDMAKLAYDYDLSSTLSGKQNLITHTIQVFSPYNELLDSAAERGHGDYKQANTAEELTDAIIKVMGNIVGSENTAFVAPVVPTNPENRTYSGYRLYLGFFYPKSLQPWHGNLKKFGLDSQLRVVDKNGDAATDADGNFLETAVSYWGSSADGGIVEEGGVGARLLADWDFTSDDNPRNIYTYLDTTNSTVSSANPDLTAGQNSFKKTNADLTPAVLGYSAASNRDALIDYIQGIDRYDADEDGNTNEKRSWMMGDILHSRPEVVNYNSYIFNATNEGTCPSDWTSASTTSNKTVLFAGSNDGMLHAFRDCDGKELWAFIPPDILPELKGLSDVAHNYYVDAPPAVYVYDADHDGNIESGDKVILLFGLRRGGSAYYALDVTDPTVPRYLWKIGPGDLAELGQSWSQPSLGVVKYYDGSSTKTMVVGFVGAGYDNENEDRRFGHTQFFTGDNSVPPAISEGTRTSTGSSTTGVSPKGRGVFAFEVATLNSGVPTIRTGSPNIIWKFTHDDATSTESAVSYNQGYLNYSIPSDITVLDTDYDGYTDRLYVGDTGGQLWRISKHKPAVSPYTDPATDGGPQADPLINSWFGKILFQANPGGNSAADGRKFFYRPSVTYEGSYIGVYIGSGDRAHPLNRDVVDRIYAVYDRGQRTNESIAEGDLVDVTSDLLQDAAPDADPATCPSDPSATGYNSIKCLLDRLYSPSNYGWYIRFDTSYGALAGEKVLAAPLVFNKVAYYTTYSPDIVHLDLCSGNLGTSRVWAVKYKTGAAVFNFNTDNDLTGDPSNPYASSTNKQAVDGDVVKNYQDRFKRLGVGIPSGLVPVINSSGDGDVIIGSGGGVAHAEVDPGGTIIPIYWMQW